MNAISLIVIFALFTGLLAPIPFLAYLLFILQSFGALALLPPELMNSNLTAGSVAALFFVIKALGSRSATTNVFRSALNFQRLGFLSLFLIVAVLGAYVLPRVFDGAIQVYAMRSARPEFVSPSMANYTQAAYLILSTMVALTVAALAKNDAFMKMLPKAIWAGGIAVIATGLMDIAAHIAGLDWVLAYFRTAGYAFMIDNYVEGTRRVIGLMTEASAYGGMAASFCGLLLFLRPVFSPQMWRWKAPAAAWGCGLMALLSTSSTAYAMMIVVLGLYALYNTHKIASDGHVVKKTLSMKILVLTGAAMVGLLILIFDRELASHFAQMVDAILFEKQKSTSYADRTHTTSVALDAFFASDGLGVGVGSVRASNFFVNILASTGVLGTGLFALFLWVIFTRRAPQAETRANVTIRAAKLALIPMFAGAALAGTTPDFGPIVGVLFGLIAGLSQTSAAPAWISPRLRNKAGADPKPKSRKARVAGAP